MRQLRRFFRFFDLSVVFSGVLLLVFLLEVRAQPAFAQAEPGGPGIDSLVFKIDSLEREIRKRALTEADKKQISQCNRTQRQFLQERRAAMPEVAEVDSALRALKLKRVRPDDPQAERLMSRKFSLEQSFENAWQTTAEGKRCTDAEAKRRSAGDAALKADPQYRALQERMKRKGLL